MKEIAIQINSQDWMSIYKSLSNIAGYELHHGDEIHLSDQVTIRLDDIWLERETFPPGTVYLILGVVSATAFHLAQDLAGNLLYDILKGEKDTTQLFIEKTTVEIEEGEIKRVIIEKLETK